MLWLLIEASLPSASGRKHRQMLSFHLREHHPVPICLPCMPFPPYLSSLWEFSQSVHGTSLTFTRSAHLRPVRPPHHPPPYVCLTDRPCIPSCSAFTTQPLPQLPPLPHTHQSTPPHFVIMTVPPLPWTHQLLDTIRHCRSSLESSAQPQLLNWPLWVPQDLQVYGPVFLSLCWLPPMLIPGPGVGWGGGKGAVSPASCQLLLASVFQSALGVASAEPTTPTTNSVLR